MSFFQETRPDGTTVRGFTDPCDPKEDWAYRYAEWLCGMSDAEYRAQVEHDEECRRYEPNRSDRKCYSMHKQLGSRVNRVPSTARRI